MLNLRLERCSSTEFILVADGTASQGMHAWESSLTSKYEVYCGCLNDSFIINRGLGCWVLLWKSSSCQFNVRKIDRQRLWLWLSSTTEVFLASSSSSIFFFLYSSPCNTFNFSLPLTNVNVVCKCLVENWGSNIELY